MLKKEQLVNQKVIWTQSSAKQTIVDVEFDKDFKQTKAIMDDKSSILLYFGISRGALRFVDDDLQKEYVSEIKKYDIEQNEKTIRLEQIHKEAIEINKKRSEEEKRNASSVKRQGKNKPDIRKDRKNIAYKATYCDGGGEWFANPCSKECREYNCMKNTRAVFCKTNSICKQVIDGKMPESKIEEALNAKTLCYESRFLTDFTVYAGRHNDNTPIGWELDNDRLVIFTTVFPNEPEKERVIFGAMLVNCSYDKDNKNEAYATSYPEYRISLSKDEAKMMKYWDYVPGEGENKDLIQWNEKLWRYQSDETCVAILRGLVEIVSKRNKEEDTEKALKFLEKFLSLIK